MDRPPPATLVESRALRAGREAAFARWSDRYATALARAPGHLGIVRLDQTGGLCHCIARCASAESLAAWRASPDCRALEAEADPLAVSLRQQAEGEDVRVAIPSDAVAPKWKRFLVTLAGVFPVLLVVSLGVRRLFPHWLPMAQLAVSSPTLTAVLQWVLLPRLQRWSRYWVLQDRNGRLRRRPG